MAFSISGASLGMTIQEWCDRLREEHLDRTERAELDKLNGAVTTGDTIITSTYAASGMRSQTRVEIGGEIMHLWGAGSTAQSFIVDRGHAGSAAGSHADGSLIRVAPRFTTHQLAEQLRREIRSWPVPLCAVAVGDVSVGASVEAVDLDGLTGTEVVRLFRVQRANPDVSETSWPVVDASLERRQDLTDFPSGYAIRFPGDHSAMTARVTLGYRFPVGTGTLDLTADLGETFHINAALADAAMFGVAGKQMISSEIERATDQNQQRPRRGEDVPPGHMLQTGQALLAQRDLMLKLENERILNQYAPSFK